MGAFQFPCTSGKCCGLFVTAASFKYYVLVDLLARITTAEATSRLSAVVSRAPGLVAMPPEAASSCEGLLGQLQALVDQAHGPPSMLHAILAQVGAGSWAV